MNDYEETLAKLLRCPDPAHALLTMIDQWSRVSGRMCHTKRAMFDNEVGKMFRFLVKHVDEGAYPREYAAARKRLGVAAYEQ